ncbi:ERF family protein [Ruegeria jejuensis]|uniref:ERF family protein n=1 Tax=Ruegeria jejuensis TaxID=3233338 RepID=UPI00355C52DA
MNQVAKVQETTAVPGTEDHSLLPADPMVTMIERVAMDPNADIDKLERMLAMKERLEDKAAETAFNEAFAQAQAEMPKIAARHNNDQTSSKYAKLNNIYDECKPIATQYGFSFNAVPVAGGRDGYLNMRWTLRRGSHSESDVSEVPIDDKGPKGTVNKTQTHAYGSTTSYGRRYLFCAVWDIAIGDDTDGNIPKQTETVSSEQFVELRDKLEESGMDPRKFHLAFGHKDPDSADLQLFPAARFKEAMDRLKKYQEAKAND